MDEIIYDRININNPFKQVEEFQLSVRSYFHLLGICYEFRNENN
jgi:hypothetical protein